MICYLVSSSGYDSSCSRSLHPHMIYKRTRSKVDCSRGRTPCTQKNKPSWLLSFTRTWPSRGVGAVVNLGFFGRTGDRPLGLGIWTWTSPILSLLLSKYTNRPSSDHTALKLCDGFCHRPRFVGLPHALVTFGQPVIVCSCCS